MPNSFIRDYYNELSGVDLEYNELTEVAKRSPNKHGKLYPIYIVLFSNRTDFALLIRKATKSVYSHSAVSLDSTMNNMYSFSNVPYDSGVFGALGFVRESIWSPQYRCCEHFRVLVTFVDKAGRDMAQKKIDWFIKNFDKYTYNTIGLIQYYLKGKNTKNHDETKKSRFFCSEFVSYMIDATEEVDGFENILQSPADLRATRNAIDLGIYTVDGFDEKELIKRTSKAENEFRKCDTLPEIDLDESVNESTLSDAYLLNEAVAKIARKKVDKRAVQRYTYNIDWKKLYLKYIELFPDSDPNLRFDLFCVIIKFYLMPRKASTDNVTDQVIEQLEKIHNMMNGGFFSMIDSEDSIIFFKSKFGDDAINYPPKIKNESTEVLDEFIHTSQLEDPDERKAMMKKYGLRPAGYGQDTRKEDEERMKKSHEWEKKIPLRQRKKIYREDGEGIVPGHEEIGYPDDALPIEESYVFNKKLLTINEDKWGKGTHNILFITGLSGSGKSTLSAEFEQAGKAEMFDIDGIEQGYDTTEKTKILTEYSKQNKNFAEFYSLVANPNKYSDKSVDEFRKEVFKKYHTKYEGWLRDIIKLLHKHNDTLYTVNGVQLFEVMNPEDFKGEPVAVVRTSVVNSMLRRMRRNSIDAGNGGKIQWKKEFENEFFQMLAWYFDDEKQLRKFKKGLKETAVSDDTKGTDQDFHNVGKAAGWYKGWTADGCQFDLEGVAQDNDSPDAGADGAYRVEAPIDSEDNPWLGTVHNLNNPDKSVNESILDKFRKTIPVKDAEKLTNAVVNKLKVLVKPYRDARLQPSYYGMADRNKCIMIELLDLDLGQYEREGYSDTLKELCKKLENDRDIKKFTEIKSFSNGDGDEGCIYINLKHPVDDTILESVADGPDKVLVDPTNPAMVDKYRKLGYEFDPSRGTIRGRAQYMYYGVKINEPAEEPKFTINIDQSGKGVCTDLVLKKLKVFIESRLNQVSTDNPESNANIAKELLYAVDLIETYLINNVDKRSVYYCELINLRTLAIDFVAKITETDASVVQDYERVKPGWYTITDGKLTTML